jgi:hypothetical protein
MDQRRRADELLRKIQRDLIRLMDIKGYDDYDILKKFRKELPDFLDKLIGNFNEFVNKSRSEIYTSRDQFKETKTKLWEIKRFISGGLNLLRLWTGNLPNNIDEEVMKQYNDNLSHYRMNVPRLRR